MPVMHIEAVITRVRAFAQAKGWSVYKLAIEAKLGSSQTLMRMWEPDWNPRAETLRKLEAVIPPDFKPDDVHRTTPLSESADHSVSS